MINPIEVNINADLGEGSANDALLMPMLSSCNIACGGHFGNITTMTAAVRLAKRHEVSVGAHPSFPDPENFGRKIMNISPEALKASIVKQLKTFEAICISENVIIHHIKPHGALYNVAAKDATMAKIVLEAIQETEINTLLYVPPTSEIANLAKKEMSICYEAFIDRTYNPDVSLVSRSVPGALIEDATKAFEQLKQLVIHQKVRTEAGWKTLEAQTYCIHGDHEHSVEILKHIVEEMPHHGMALKS